MNTFGSLPAFPVQKITGHYQGITVRDYFAIQAMAGIVAVPGDVRHQAKMAYRIADEMLKARAPAPDGE